MREVFLISGSGSALSLTLNIEQYEYMSGPEHEAGLKVGDSLIYRKNLNYMPVCNSCRGKNFCANIHIGRL